MSFTYPLPPQLLLNDRQRYIPPRRSLQNIERRFVAVIDGEVAGWVVVEDGILQLLGCTADQNNNIIRSLTRGTYDLTFLPKGFKAGTDERQTDPPGTLRTERDDFFEKLDVVWTFTST